MSDRERVCAVDDVPTDTTFLFRVRDGDDEVKEAVLVRAADGVHGWLNYCMHLTDVNLDKGPGATMRDGEILCENHGAYFEADSGYCNYGPCEGAVLPAVDVAVDDGAVVLTDEDLSFVGTGGVETDPVDRASKTNVEF